MKPKVFPRGKVPPKGNVPLKGKGPPKGKVPLERALSKLGIASRTQGRQMIKSGRIKVGGVVRKDPLYLVVPESANIQVDDVKIEKADRVVLMLNKPRNVVTTRSDEKGRPTVFSLINDKDLYLHAVGRLDIATTGLLLLTNDSRLSAWLTDPENNLERVYVVTVRGGINEAKVTLLEKGVEDEGELLRATRAVLRKTSRRESHLIVTLSQGKNREIRRLFKLVGNEVTRLKRVSYGGLELGVLPLGEYREVPQKELEEKIPNLLRTGIL